MPRVPQPEHGQQLLYVPGEMYSEDNTEVEPALIAQCSRCSGVLFVVYYIAGSKWPHLQCPVCDTSYGAGAPAETATPR